MTRHVPRQARAPISERPAEPLPVQCLAVPGGDAMRFSVGIDWASAAHAVCILDQTGRVHWQGAVPHTADGLADLLARLRRFRRRGSLRVALERPSGLLVDTLLDAGLEVVPIHPNALKASRPRYSAAGAKSDPGDAFILADLLRTDGHRFRPLHPPSDDTRALRALVRGRDDLVAQRIALANQLRALLERFWPGAAAIFADVDSPIALAFLARYPTPDSAARQRRAVVFRWACNKRLRRAVTTFADNSRHASRWAALVYQRARARGCRHQHAIRILARAWARILWRCWQDRTPYHVGRHRAAQALAAA